MIVQADLFRTQEEQTVPMQGVWYPARFVSWEYTTSPTQGEMRRLIGELTVPPLAGWAIWKPLTHDLAGIRWTERALKAADFPAYRLAALRRPGLGEYLDELCRQLVQIGPMQVRLYPYQWQTDTFWTVDRVKHA